MMKGWKTWITVIGFFIIGLLYIFKANSFEEGVKYMLIGIGVLGIGHKIEKINK